MYFINVIKRLFPRSVEYREEWSAGTASFEIQNLSGSADLALGEKILAELKATLGSAEISINAKPDTRYNTQEYDNACGVILKITITGVKFPATPS